MEVRRINHENIDPKGGEEPLTTELVVAFVFSLRLVTVLLEGAASLEGGPQAKDPAWTVPTNSPPVPASERISLFGKLTSLPLSTQVST